MRQIYTNQQVHRYQFIDWSKPEPVVPSPYHYLTSHEAEAINRAMALNRQTSRYIRTDNV